MSAAIAAVYVVLTVIFAPISFSAVQVRIAEALTVLPMFSAAAIPGLFIGCVIGNILGGGVVLDVIFGSIATLIGAVGSYLLRNNRWLVPLPPIISNTLIIPFVLKYAYGMDLPILLIMLYILIGELLSCYVLGELLISLIEKTGTSLFKEE
jgi:uncharacterized membrane protein